MQTRPQSQLLSGAHLLVSIIHQFSDQSTIWTRSSEDLLSSFTVLKISISENAGVFFLHNQSSVASSHTVSFKDCQDCSCNFVKLEAIETYLSSTGNGLDLSTWISVGDTVT